MMPRPIIVVLVFVALSVGGCQSAGPASVPGAADPEVAARDEGYALLYSTLSEESDVDKVLIIKRPAAPVAELVKAIGQFSRESKAAIQALAKEDPRVNLEHQGLPELETKTRDSIGSDTSKQIIFHGGKDFEFRILLTQHEALNYVGHLAGVLAEREPRENRKRFLTQFVKQADALHEQVLGQMKAAYVGQAK
jgi:hypothetical protein